MCLGMSGLFFGVLSAQNVSYNISGTITYTVEDAEPIEDFTFEILSEPDGNTPGTAKVVSYNGSATSVEIPSSIGSKVESSGDSTDTSDGSSSGSSSSGSSSSSGETSYNEPIWTISSYSEFDSIMSSESAEMIMIYFGYFTLTCNDGSASEQQYTIKDFSEFCKTIWGDSYSSDTEPDATVFNEKCPMTFDCTTFECSNLTEFNTKSENFSEESSDSTTTTSTKVVFDDSTTTDTTTSVVTLGEVFFQKMYYMLNYLDYLFEFSVAGEYIPSSVLAEILSAAAEDFSTISKSINEDPDSSFPMVVSNVREEIIVAPTGGLEYTINSYEEFLTLASDEFNAGLIEAGFFYITYTDDGETKSKYIKDFFEFYMIFMMKGGTSDEGMTTAINSMAPIVFNHSTFTCTVANNQSTSQASSSSTLGQLFFKKLLLLLENGHTFTYTDSSGSKFCSMFNEMYTTIKTYANSTTALDDSLFPIQITNVSEVVIPTGGLEYTFNSYEEFVAMMLSGFSDGGLNLLPFCGFFYVSYTDGAKTVTKYIKDLTQFSTIVENKAGGTTDDATKAAFTSMIPIVFNHSTFYCTVTDNQTKSESFSSYTLGQMFFKKLYLLLEYGYTFTYTDTSGSKFCSMFNEMYTTIKTYANSTTALDDSLFPIQITNVKEIVEPTSGGIEFQMASYDDYLSVFQDEVKIQLLTYGFFTLTYNDNGTETTVVIRDFFEFSDILNENLTDTEPSEEVIDALFKELDMTINHLTFECTVANNQTTSKMNSSYTLGQYFFKKLLFLLDNGYNFAYKTSSEVKYCTKDSDLYTTIKGYAESTTALSDDIFPVKVFGVGYTCSTDVVDDDSTSDDSGSSYTKGDTYLVVSIGDSVFSGKTSITSITIPNTITKIGNSVFKNCKGLETLVIPSSVTSIGNSAFFGCTGFTTFTLPDNVTVLGISMFYGCSSLTSITLPTSLQAIPDSMFYGCTSLTTLTVPKSVTSIGTSAFSDCTSLASVTWENGSGLTSLGEKVFYSCSALNQLTLPSSLTSIGLETFRYSGLTTLTVPKSVTSIGTSAFSDCTSLASVTWENGSGLTSLGEKVFYSCSALNQLTLPSSLTSIGLETFRYSGLTTLTVPKSVTSIGTSAFSDCTSLASVTWENGSGLTNLGASAFGYCTLLSSMTIPSKVESVGNSVFVGCSNISELTLPFVGSSPTTDTFLGYLFGGSEYKDNSKIVPIKLKKVKVTGGTNSTNIGDYAFYECTSLTSVEISTNISSIGSYAFMGCSGLSSIDIPESVTKIDNFAFSLCTGLTSFKVPNGMQSVGCGVFYGCSSMTHLTTPFVGDSACSLDNRFDLSSIMNLSGSYDGPETFLGYMFGYNLKSIFVLILYAAFGGNVPTLNDTLTNVTLTTGTYVSDLAFFGFTGLTTITTNETIKKVGNYAFFGCSSLTSIDILDDIDEVGSMAFSGCSNLVYTDSETNYQYIKTTNNNYFYLQEVPNKDITSTSLKDGCKFIGDEVFKEFTKLETVSIPDSVVSVGASAFSGCSNLVSVEMSSNLEFIYASAFKNCSNLTTFTLSQNITSLSDSVFSGCSSLASIVIPENVTSVGDSAFSDCSSLKNIVIPSTVLSLGSSAFSGCSGLESITISDKLTDIKASTFSGCSKLASITIPSGVTSIGDSAFASCSSLTVMDIPSGTTTLGTSAFSGCSGLETISIPNSVVSVGDDAFLNCDKLKNTVDTYTYIKTTTNDYYYFLSISDTTITSISLNSNCKFIGNNAFKNCTSLTSVDIPNNIFGVGGSAFYGCTALQTVTIPTSVTRVGSSAFYQTGLTSVTIPESVTAIEEKTFSGCTALASITLPDNLKSIGKYAFNACSKLSSITLPSQLTELGQYAFYNCSSLTSIDVPSKVTTLDDYTFYGCTSLKSITLPDNLNSIEDYVFAYCSNLTSIILSDNVGSIGSYAFDYCSNLTSIKMPNLEASSHDEYYVMRSLLGSSSTALSISSDAFRGCSKLNSVCVSSANDWINISFSSETSNPLYYNANLYENNQKVTTITISDEITEIPNYAFVGSRLSSITIPDSVTKIGKYAFKNCSYLSSITIPEGVTSIEEYTFYGCSNLTSIVIPNSVTKIGQYAFYNCSGLQSITLSNSLTEISLCAFYGCRNLTSIVLPDTVKSIANQTFYNCSNLTKLTSYASSIGREALSGCSKLSTLTVATDGYVDLDYSGIGDCVLLQTTVDNYVYVTINNSLYYLLSVNDKTTLTSVSIDENCKSIGSDVFNGCSSLTSVTLPSGLVSLGSQAFKDCSSLTSITLPTGLISLGYGAFSGCSALESIDIPNTVTYVGSYAFENCTGLKSLTLSDNISELGEYSFSKCTSLTSVSIPSGKVGSRAFINCSSLTEVKIGANVNYIGFYTFYGCSSLTSAVFEGTKTWYVEKNFWTTNTFTLTGDSAKDTKYLTSTYVAYHWEAR